MKPKASDNPKYIPKISKCPIDGKKRSKEAMEEKEALVLALEKKMMTTLRQQQESGSVKRFLSMYCLLIGRARLITRC